MKLTLPSFTAIASAAVLAFASLPAQAENITLSSTTIGATDNTTAWWGAQSSQVELPVGKMLTFEFDNYNPYSKAKWKVWNNWVLVLSTTTGYSTNDNSSYSEYFALRADAYGWGNSDYSGSNISSNYNEIFTNSGAADYDTFLMSELNGAHVVVELQRLSSGVLYVTATATSTAGNVFVMNYHQNIASSASAYAFLTIDASHIENLTAVRATATKVAATVSSLSVANASGVTHYFATGATTTKFIKASAIVTAHMSDGTTEVIPTSQITFPETISKDGKFTATYSGKTVSGVASVSSETVTISGSEDLTNEWNQALTSDFQVKKGETVTKSFQVRVPGDENYHCPLVLVRNAAQDYYGVFRLDNYAFMGETNSVNSTNFGTLTSNWDWSNFLVNMDGSYCTVSVTNNGGTYDVKYDLVDGGGVSHYQYFTGCLSSSVTQTDEDDLYFALSADHGYLVFLQSGTSAIRQIVDGVDVKVQGGEISVSGADSFEVYDINGRKVASNGLPRGLYIVRVAGVAKTVVVK